MDIMFISPVMAFDFTFQLFLPYVCDAFNNMFYYG